MVIVISSQALDGCCSFLVGSGWSLYFLMGSGWMLLFLDGPS